MPMNKAPALFAFFSCWSLVAFAQAQDPALSAGGLAPPPKVEGQGAAPGADGTTGEPGTGSPDQALQEADREDSGRGLEFVWLNGEAGVTYIDLGALSDNNLTQPGLPSPDRAGYLVGGGLGVRLLFFTAGARFRWAKVTNNFFKHWSVGGEAKVHFPLGSFEPYGGLGVGYSRFWDVAVMADLDGNSVPLPNPNDPAGLHVRLLGGADYYLTNMFSVGLNLSGEMLMLWRAATPGFPASDVNSLDATSVGLAVAATAVAGLHF